MPNISQAPARFKAVGKGLADPPEAWWNAPGDIAGSFFQQLGRVPQALAHLGSQWPFDLFGGGSKKKDPPPATTTPQPTSTNVTVQPPDAVTAGLGMFFQQYLAPMLSQLGAQQNTAINAYGNLANQAANLPGVSPSQKASIESQTAQDQMNLQGLNEAAANQSVYGPLYAQVMNQLGNQNQAMQQLLGWLNTQGMLSMSPQALQQLWGREMQGGNPVLGGLLNAIATGGSVVPGQGGSTPSKGKGATTPAVGTAANPQTVPSFSIPQTVPTTAPTTTNYPGASPSDIANAIAQSMLQQQASAQAANQAASAGYTP
jgi:hypothetical protein